MGIYAIYFSSKDFRLAHISGKKALTRGSYNSKQTTFNS